MEQSKHLIEIVKKKKSMYIEMMYMLELITVLRPNHKQGLVCPGTTNQNLKF
jgi:hypothetical protein